MDLGETITAAATRFGRTRRMSDLLAMLRLVHHQGRTLEAAYGAYCFAVHRPGRLVAPAGDFDAGRIDAAARVALAALATEKSERLGATIRGIVPEETDLDCTYHGFAQTDSGFVLGEYAERSARIFVHDGSRVRLDTPYRDDASVRHLHSILHHGDHLYVSTGDTGKYLDRFRFVDGDLRFDRRLLRRFGGFTTCAVVGGSAWFGSDFSERPNYLYCLETGRKHFFPAPAYKKWCLAMAPLEDRYLYCVNTRLESFSNRRAVSIFDTRLGAFVHSMEVEPGDSPI